MPHQIFAAVCPTAPYNENKKNVFKSGQIYMQDAEGYTKPQTSASCGHLRTVVQTIQISGL